MHPRSPQHRPASSGRRLRGATPSLSLPMPLPAVRPGMEFKFSLVVDALWFTLVAFWIGAAPPLNPGRPAAALVGERVHRSGVVLELWVRAVPALQLAPCMHFFFKKKWEVPLEKAPFAKACVTAVTQPCIPCHRVSVSVITRAAMPHTPAACCDVPCSGQGTQHTCYQSENENSVPGWNTLSPPQHRRRFAIGLGQAAVPRRVLGAGQRRREHSKSQEAGTVARRNEGCPPHSPSPLHL